jgi:hypothetical protein
MHCENAIDGRVVHIVERMGVPIGVIKDRRTMVADPVGALSQTAKK